MKKITEQEILNIKDQEIIWEKFRVVRLDNEDPGSFYDVYIIEGGLLIEYIENEDGSFSNILVGKKENLDMTGYAEDVVFYLNEYVKKQCNSNKL